MSLVYCIFCGFKIGMCTWNNLDAMHERYVKHIVKSHELEEVAKKACWTMEAKTKNA